MKFAVCILLVAITWAVFGQTLGHQFVNYDDPAYVTDNAHVRAGLNWPGVLWAFTHVHSQNWHPLTSISHMLDCQLFGRQPGVHHFVNVLLHSIGVLLLFLLPQQMTGGPSRTGNTWMSAFVAAVFAIHPLRVESVAWIAERKDVLSGVFFMLTSFDPDNGDAANNLAWVLATSADLRNGREAVALAKHAARLAGGENPGVLRTLAAALAEDNRFTEAIATAERGQDLAQASGDVRMIESLRSCAELFRRGLPLHRTQVSH